MVLKNQLLGCQNFKDRSFFLFFVALVKSYVKLLNVLVLQRSFIGISLPYFLVYSC
jgi:hypothetical protein